jgi:hypothetical protein
MADVFKLISIESLKSEDEKTGQQLVEWANDKFKETLISANNLFCENKEAFIEILKKLKDNSTANETLILSLEMHGNDKGLFLADDSFISWFELVPYIRNLNEKTQMGLVILSSACFGAYFCLAVSLEYISPFYKFFGPDNKIHSDKILDINKDILESIFRDKDISLTIEDKNKYFMHSDVKYVYLDAGDVFRKVFTNYINQDLSPGRMVYRTAKYYNEFRSYSYIYGAPIEHFQKFYVSQILDKNYNEKYFYKVLDRFLIVNIKPSLFEKIPITFEEVWKDSGIENIYQELIERNNIF